jgi:hypothetical protein
VADHVLDELVDLGRVADVAHPAERLPAGAGDLVDDHLHPVGAQVHDRDAGSFVGEEVRRGAAHPTRRAGDDGDVAGDRS